MLNWHRLVLDARFWQERGPDPAAFVVGVGVVGAGAGPGHGPLLISAGAVFAAGGAASPCCPGRPSNGGWGEKKKKKIGGPGLGAGSSTTQRPDQRRDRWPHRQHAAFLASPPWPLAGRGFCPMSGRRRRFVALLLLAGLQNDPRRSLQRWRGGWQRPVRPLAAHHPALLQALPAGWFAAVPLAQPGRLRSDPWCSPRRAASQHQRVWRGYAYLNAMRFPRFGYSATVRSACLACCCCWGACWVAGFLRRPQGLSCPGTLFPPCTDFFCQATPHVRCLLPPSLHNRRPQTEGAEPAAAGTLVAVVLF